MKHPFGKPMWFFAFLVICWSPVFFFKWIFGMWGQSWHFKLPFHQAPLPLVVGEDGVCWPSKIFHTPLGNPFSPLQNLVGLRPMLIERNGNCKFIGNFFPFHSVAGRESKKVLFCLSTIFSVAEKKKDKTEFCLFWPDILLKEEIEKPHYFSYWIVLINHKSIVSCLWNHQVWLLCTQDCCASTYFWKANVSLNVWSSSEWKTILNFVMWRQSQVKPVFEYASRFFFNVWFSIRCWYLTFQFPEVNSNWAFKNLDAWNFLSTFVYFFTISSEQIMFPLWKPILCYECFNMTQLIVSCCQWAIILKNRCSDGSSLMAHLLFLPFFIILKLWLSPDGVWFLWM